MLGGHPSLLIGGGPGFALGNQTTFGGEHPTGVGVNISQEVKVEGVIFMVLRV